MKGIFFGVPQVGLISGNESQSSINGYSNTSSSGKSIGNPVNPSSGSIHSDIDAPPQIARTERSQPIIAGIPSKFPNTSYQAGSNIHRERRLKAVESGGPRSAHIPSVVPASVNNGQSFKADLAYLNGTENRIATVEGAMRSSKSFHFNIYDEATRRTIQIEGRRNRENSSWKMRRIDLPSLPSSLSGTSLIRHDATIDSIGIMILASFLSSKMIEAKLSNMAAEMGLNLKGISENQAVELLRLPFDQLLGSLNSYSSNGFTHSGVYGDSPTIFNILKAKGQIPQGSQPQPLTSGPPVGLPYGPKHPHDTDDHCCIGHDMACSFGDPLGDVKITFFPCGSMIVNVLECCIDHDINLFCGIDLTDVWSDPYDQIPMTVATVATPLLLPMAAEFAYCLEKKILEKAVEEFGLCLIVGIPVLLGTSIPFNIALNVFVLIVTAGLVYQAVTDPNAQSRMTLAGEHDECCVCGGGVDTKCCTGVSRNNRYCFGPTGNLRLICGGCNACQRGCGYTGGEDGRYSLYPTFEFYYPWYDSEQPICENCIDICEQPCPKRLQLTQQEIDDLIANDLYTYDEESGITMVFTPWCSG